MTLKIVIGGKTPAKKLTPAQEYIAKVVAEKGDFKPVPYVGEIKRGSNVLEVHQSSINLWRRCRYAYYLKNVQGLVRRRKSRPLQFGTMVHSMIEAYANGDDPMETLDAINIKDAKLFRSEKEEYGEIIDDIRVIMTEYFEFHGEDSIRYQRMNKRGAEHKFKIEIAPGVVLAGKIDAFGKTPNKLRWLVEHKTFSQMPTEDHRWRNLQSSLYIRVNDIMGWPAVDGTLWDYVYSKPPSYPQVLKSGKMSQRGIDSLPTRVIATLKENKLDPKNFKTMIDSVTANRKRYFQRIFTPKKRKVIDLVWNDMLETVREMAVLVGVSKAKTIDKHCQWCEFEPLCRAEFVGADVDYIREKEYHVGKDYYGTSPAEEV